MNSEMLLEKSKRDFLEILKDLNNERQLESFKVFVKAAIHAKNLELKTSGSINSENKNKIIKNKIDNIIQDLREAVPITAEAPNENIFENYTSDTTIHVDSFLYDEDDVDRLCDEGKLPSAYCVQCKSRNTRQLTSVFLLHFIFETLLKGKTDDKVLLDIGSRLGGVLYLGYFYSHAKKIIGIEMNPFFANLQKEIISKYDMNDRVEVIQDDILNQAQLVHSSNIIIMRMYTPSYWCILIALSIVDTLSIKDNVFQFFHALPIQQRLWSFIRDNTAPSTLLITIPSLEEQLADASCKIDYKKWVKEMKLDVLPNELEMTEENIEALQSIHLYQVK
ncbi:12231_t:CDS:2 [Ambispora gerdemannii]|uniref:12231_t:CDS:1 n=1 Tax=Ambispora gerdemannii TaxID=144530 RepID=A0A9N9FB51_9GLOM|nr:12231_t:CDS:2 [Ambispora gerdemannii]